jgi:hypothetical protein
MSFDSRSQVFFWLRDNFLREARVVLLFQRESEVGDERLLRVLNENHTVAVVQQRSRA